MSKKFIISESERKNILSYYLKKGIILESNEEPITKETNFKVDTLFVFPNTSTFQIQELPPLSPDESFKESGGKIIASINVNPYQKQEENIEFFKKINITEYNDKEIKIEKIVIEFDKVVDDADKIADNIKYFRDYKERIKPDFVGTTYNLCDSLIQKGMIDPLDADYETDSVLLYSVNGIITSVTFKVISDSIESSEVETDSEPESQTKSEPKSQTKSEPESVGDSGLPEGEFQDEILTQGKKNEPGWFKRLLTREKTELMKNLKFLQDKFIKVGNLYFKINKVKASSERQNVVVFSCKQQKLNVDMVNDPKFKFFGNKDYFFSCRDSAESSFFYESNSKNIYKDVFYGTSSEDVKNKSNDLRDFVFERICKKLNPKK